jgi:hypothetical protein
MEVLENFVLLAPVENADILGFGDCRKEGILRLWEHVQAVCQHG